MRSRHSVAAQNGHGFKQRRSILAPADGHADGLEHGAGLHAEGGGGVAERLFQRIVIEGRCGQHLLRMLQDAAGERGVALLRNQLGGVVRRELVDKEKIGGGDGLAQERDALADERRDLAHFFRRGMQAGPLEERLDAGAEIVDAEGADMLCVQPHGLGIEWVFLFEIDDGVGAVDVFESERGGELVEAS